MNEYRRSAAVQLAVKALVALAIACSAPSPSVAAPAVAPLVDPDLVLIATPHADHAPFVTAIDGAAKSIDMTMFHLTHPDVADALVRAAGRGVRVRVILDGKSLETKKFERVAAKLRAGHVEVRGSSPQFSITHVKAMVIDGATAFITAINLTKDVGTTRDFGVVTKAKGVVADVAALFAADWDNAAGGGNTTPAIHEPSLVVSPVSSRERLIGLIASAKRDLAVTVENLGDPAIRDALLAAVKRHVAVKLIVPMCDKNADPLHNFDPTDKLAAGGVTVRMMPQPETVDTPYMHSKMILADGTNAYVGSINFSTNSTTKARELGIIFANPAAATAIRTAFDADWQHATPPPATRPTDCPKVE
jgi:phosphatidylserine/phosphatidylglycerophosphate/cardiolipin synthase-like enzyme